MEGVKAKIKQTGEIVTIIRFGYTGDCTMYIDARGVEHYSYLNRYTDFEEIEEPKEIDWEQRRYEIAKALFVQACIGCDIDVAANFSVHCADHLIMRLKKKEEQP